jgi:preprotein translocase subunit SecG
MLYIIYAIHVIICLFLIMVVLLQQGSGADLSVFGGGGTQTAFGARSATSLLHKLTVAGFVGFILTTIAFGFLKTGGGGGSVMSDVEQAAPQSEVDIEDTAIPAADADTVSATDSASAEEASPVETDGLEDSSDPDRAVTPETSDEP